MQCKDIPDDEFLEAVETACQIRDMKYAMIWDVRAILSGYPEHVDTTEIHKSENVDNYLPWNLIRAKARKLIRKGSMDGCVCGCRGDFRLLIESPSERLIRRENQKKALIFFNSRAWLERGGFVTNVFRKLKAN